VKQLEAALNVNGLEFVMSRSFEREQVNRSPVGGVCVCVCVAMVVFWLFWKLSKDILEAVTSCQIGSCRRPGHDGFGYL
jgi:type VI protein secretion system component VasF